ncbi:MAG TPA: heat-inducible transcriptional repressor HrcA [Actinomycetota bacterium]|nr:heat-inducible transcriptional repressor HrcA [Actinomycetota bacterium]
MERDRPELDERKAAILRAIVSHYVGSGEPVGSKTIVERFDLRVSAATVRNEMGALEAGGFIYQPHTSAGRVPTDAGYRYFVDAWTGDVRLPSTEARRVRSFFVEPRWELEEALRRTASLLSSLTDHAAVVFAPALDRSLVRHVELVGLGGRRAMLVVVTDTGRVENHVILTPEHVDEVDLDQTADMLNRVVAGVALELAARAVAGNLERFPLELRATAEAVATVLREEMSRGEVERIFLEGTSNIVDEHKFADLETVRRVIGALEHRRVLLELLADALSQERVAVRIGSENAIEQMQPCSVISASYGAEGKPVGSLAVVGPTRMDYRRTIAAVHEVASNLGRMLGESGE